MLPQCVPPRACGVVWCGVVKRGVAWRGGRYGVQVASTPGMYRYRYRAGGSQLQPRRRACHPIPSPGAACPPSPSPSRAQLAGDRVVYIRKHLQIRPFACQVTSVTPASLAVQLSMPCRPCKPPATCPYCYVPSMEYRDPGNRAAHGPPLQQPAEHSRQPIMRNELPVLRSMFLAVASAPNGG